MHGVVSSGPPLCSLDLAAFWKPELGDVAAQLIFPGLVPRLRFRGEDGDPFSQLALPWIREVSAEGGGREEVSLGRRIAAHHTVDDAWWIGRMVQGEASIGVDVRRCEDAPLYELVEVEDRSRPSEADPLQELLRAPVHLSRREAMQRPPEAERVAGGQRAVEPALSREDEADPLTDSGRVVRSRSRTAIAALVAH